MILTPCPYDPIKRYFAFVPFILTPCPYDTNAMPLWPYQAVLCLSPSLSSSGCGTLPLSHYTNTMPLWPYQKTWVSKKPPMKYAPSPFNKYPFWLNLVRIKTMNNTKIMKWWKQVLRLRPHLVRLLGAPHLLGGPPRLVAVQSMLVLDYCLTTFPFIWSSFASHVCISVQIT